MASDKVINVTGENYESAIINSDTPVLVDFWATWCGPCKRIAPILDELAEELDGQLTVAKINIDDARDLAAKHKVRGIPFLMVVKNGEILKSKAGAMNKNALLDFVSEAL